MAEVQEVRDYRQIPVPARRTRPGTLILTFLLGVLCTVAVGITVLSVFDIHGTISWPAGRIEVGQNGATHVLIRQGTQ